MANRAYKHIEYLCDNGEEDGKISIVHSIDTYGTELTLGMTDCYKEINLDFGFKTEDGYSQRLSKIDTIRRALDLMEERMKIHKVAVTPKSLNDYLTSG